jgi:hypothetical protein
MGVVSHFLIVRRVALAAINWGWGYFFMRFLGRLWVTRQALNVPMTRIAMIFRHLCVAFRALVVGITNSRIVLRRRGQWAPHANKQHHKLEKIYLHVRFKSARIQLSHER